MSRKMSKAEIEAHIAQVRTGLAFGGGELSRDSEQQLIRVLSGESSYAQERERLRSEHMRNA